MAVWPDAKCVPVFLFLIILSCFKKKKRKNSTLWELACPVSSTLPGQEMSIGHRKDRKCFLIHSNRSNHTLSLGIFKVIEKSCTLICGKGDENFVLIELNLSLQT